METSFRENINKLDEVVHGILPANETLEDKKVISEYIKAYKAKNQPTVGH